MSATYLPVIDHLDTTGAITVCRVLLEGSPVSVVAAMQSFGCDTVCQPDLDDEKRERESVLR